MEIRIPSIEDLLRTDPSETVTPDIDTMMKAVWSGSPVPTNPAPGSYAAKAGRADAESLLREQFSRFTPPSANADLEKAVLDIARASSPSTMSRLAATAAPSDRATSPEPRVWSWETPMSDGIVARTTREQERRERSTKTGEGGDLAKCSEETEFVKLASGRLLRPASGRILTAADKDNVEPEEWDFNSEASRIQKTATDDRTVFCEWFRKGETEPFQAYFVTTERAKKL